MLSRPQEMFIRKSKNSGINKLMRYREDKLEVNIRIVCLCLSSEKLYVLPWGQMSYWGNFLLPKMVISFLTK